MNASGTTSFLEELTKSDDLGDVRAGSFAGQAEMQLPFWNSGQPAINQFNQYSSMNKPQRPEMMTPRTPQLHGYNSYTASNSSSMTGNMMYGYPGSNVARPSANPMWPSDKSPYMHPNMASPQQSSRMNMYYTDSMQQQQQQQQQRLQGYQGMQPMMSPRQPEMMPSSKQPTSQPQQFMYPQQLPPSKESSNRTENPSTTQTKSPQQGKSNGDSGSKPQPQHSLSSLQQMNYNNNHPQQPPSFHSPNQIMHDQYNYRMPPYHSQGIMLSPGSQQQQASNMKGYMAQSSYPSNPMYWQHRSQYQGDMAYQLNQANQPPYNSMQQQQYIQQQKHYQMQYQQGQHLQQQHFYRHPEASAYMQNQQPMSQFQNPMQQKPSGSSKHPYPQQAQ